MKPTKTTSSARKPRPVRTVKPALPRGCPQKPVGLPPEVDALWTYYAGILCQVCLLMHLDRGGILRLAEATAAVDALNRVHREKGSMVTTKAGVLRLAPHFYARERALHAEQKLLDEFLLTPASRARFARRT